MELPKVSLGAAGAGGEVAGRRGRMTYMDVSGGHLIGEPDGSYSFPLLAFNCCHALLSSALSGEFETLEAPAKDAKLATACSDVQLEDFRCGRRSSSVLSEFHRGIMRRLSDADDEDMPLIKKAHERVS